MIIFDEKYLKTLIYTPRKIVLTMHRKPDGDSVGSNLALYEALSNLGHTVTMFSKDVIPRTLTFLPHVNKIIVLPPSQIKWENFDIYFCLDMSSLDMLGEPVQLPAELQTINIDHHFTNVRWATHSILDFQEISTASVLLEVFKIMKITVTKEMARCLMTGLATDSGFFAYNNDVKAFKTATELLEYGIDYQEIIFNIQKQIYTEDLIFLGKALEHLLIYQEERVFFLPVSNEIWTHYGISENKNYLLTDYVRSIRATNFGVVIIEETPGNFRLEFRSRLTTFDVSAIARQLGGGGHKNAAGARVVGSTKEKVIQDILKLA